MPRKSKEELKTDKKLVESTEISTKTKTAKTTKKASNSTKNKLNADTAKKSANSSKTSKSKTSKSASTKSTKKTSATKTAAKTTTRAKSKASEKTNSVIPSVEYYDLPYRYNETVVKILAQTPTMLFIYWDISDADRNSYVEKYGENFFNETKPVLIVRNKTMNYTFEVDINDFANSWYLHVNDADCDYSVELGRRPINHNTNIGNYVYVTTSNDMEMPNNHILFDRLGKSVFFKNVKNNFVEEKETGSISFIKNMGKVYDIYEFYKEIYKDEINEETNSALKLNLSSSSSSTFM